MSKYPLIEAMGLDVHTEFRVNYVHANDLEKALQAAPVWYGVPKLDSWSSADICPEDTHTARLVCVQPVKKKTKGEAAIELLQEIIDLNEPKSLVVESIKQEAQKILEMPE